MSRVALGDDDDGLFCLPETATSWMELSLPTVSGSDGMGKRTVSRTGRTGKAVSNYFVPGFSVRRDE